MKQDLAMLRATRTLHPVPTIVGAGFIAPRFENDAPARLPADDNELFKDFVKRLRAGLMRRIDEG
jgi:hypothetical protein